MDSLRDLRNVQFAQVESGLLRDPQIRPPLKALYGVLITYGPSSIFPGQQRLADDLGVKRETVNRWLCELRELGLIDWARRGSTSNEYVILGYDNRQRCQAGSNVIVGSQQEKPNVIVGSQQMCARDHNRCDPGITRSISSYPDPDTQKEEDDPILIKDLIDLIGFQEEQAREIAGKEDPDRVRHIMALTIKNSRKEGGRAGYFLGCLKGASLAPLQQDEIERIIKGARAVAALPVYANDWEPMDVDELPEPVLIPGCDLEGRALLRRVLTELRGMMTGATFTRWLGVAEVLGAREGVLEVGVRDQYAVDWLEARWKRRIGDLVAAIAGVGLEVAFVPIGA